MSTYKLIYQITGEMFNSITPARGREKVINKWNITTQQADRIYEIGCYLMTRNTNQKIASGEMKMVINS